MVVLLKNLLKGEKPARRRVPLGWATARRQASSAEDVGTAFNGVFPGVFHRLVLWETREETR